MNVYCTKCGNAIEPTCYSRPLGNDGAGPAVLTSNDNNHTLLTNDENVRNHESVSSNNAHCLQCRSATYEGNFDVQDSIGNRKELERNGRLKSIVYEDEDQQSLSLSGGHYESDSFTETSNPPDESLDPPGWTCKFIVFLCGMSTFARTEAVLLQTVFFAECQKYGSAQFFPIAQMLLFLPGPIVVWLIRRLERVDGPTSVFRRTLRKVVIANVSSSVALFALVLEMYVARDSSKASHLAYFWMPIIGAGATLQFQALTELLSFFPSAFVSILLVGSYSSFSVFAPVNAIGLLCVKADPMMTLNVTCEGMSQNASMPLQNNSSIAQLGQAVSAPCATWEVQWNYVWLFYTVAILLCLQSIVGMMYFAHTGVGQKYLAIADATVSKEVIRNFGRDETMRTARPVQPDPMKHSAVSSIKRRIRRRASATWLLGRGRDIALGRFLAKVRSHRGVQDDSATADVAADSIPLISRSRAGTNASVFDENFDLVLDEDDSDLNAPSPTSDRRSLSDDEIIEPDMMNGEHGPVWGSQYADDREDDIFLETTSVSASVTSLAQITPQLYATFATTIASNLVASQYDKVPNGGMWELPTYLLYSYYIASSLSAILASKFPIKSGPAVVLSTMQICIVFFMYWYIGMPGFRTGTSPPRSDGAIIIFNIIFVAIGGWILASSFTTISSKLSDDISLQQKAVFANNAVYFASMLAALGGSTLIGIYVWQ